MFLFITSNRVCLYVKRHVYIEALIRINFNLPLGFVSVKNVSMGEITDNRLQGKKRKYVLS